LSLLDALAQKPSPDSKSVKAAWDAVEAKYAYDPWADLDGRRLLANSSTLTAEVDYQTAYAINERRPFSGSSQADFKLAADGTLNEASGQVQDNTFATIASALPISSLITSAAGITTKVGAAATKEEVRGTGSVHPETGAAVHQNRPFAVYIGFPGNLCGGHAADKGLPERRPSDY
jgi:hypothetical protein